jgi:CRP/FNR family cyclic AMP-dependent transcriptional regulator
MLDPQLLADVDLFRSLSPEAVERIINASVPRSLRRGDVLFQEGDDAAELFVVESGRVAIANRSPDGRESVVALMEPGDLFGEMPLFDDMGRSAHARALEVGVVHAIPYRAVREVLEDDPALLWGVVELLARRLRSMDNALADAVFLDVTGRTAKRLLELAGDADEFTLPVTQEELAGLVGASRERVNKALASFIRLGWVEQRDRRYTITDRTQLTRRAR